MFSNITFSELGVCQEVLNALNEIGYTNPTGVQEKSFKVLKEGKDLLVQSRTGTGKTLAFGLPILEMVTAGNRHPQCIILTPTRELAIQIKEELKVAGKNLRLKTNVVYGGSSINDQIRFLKKGVDILVGTPGRVCDLINRGALKLNDIKKVVLDEADEMLDMGFLDDLTLILNSTPDSRQTLLFSATFPKQIRRIAEKYLTDPHFIENDTELRANTSIAHYVYECFNRLKIPSLVNILHLENPSKAILFCQTKNETEQVSNALRAEKFMSGFINGDLSQAQRIRVLDQFKLGEINILVATDVAARGIDIKDITHVINFSVPQQTETYIHRSGRTGRAGREGESVILITPSERERFWKMERESKIDFSRREVPQPDEISFVKKERFIDKLQNHEVAASDFETFKKYAEELLKDEDALDLVTKLLGMYSDDMIKLNAGYEVEAPKEARRGKKEFLSNTSKKGGRGRDRDRGGRGRDRFESDGNNEKIYINLGRESGFYPKELLTLLNQMLPKRPKNVGKIDVFGKFTFFQVPRSEANEIVDHIHNKSYQGRKILCEIARPRK